MDLSEEVWRGQTRHTLTRVTQRFRAAGKGRKSVQIGQEATEKRAQQQEVLRRHGGTRLMLAMLHAQCLGPTSFHWKLRVRVPWSGGTRRLLKGSGVGGEEAESERHQGFFIDRKKQSCRKKETDFMDKGAKMTGENTLRV